MKGFATKAGQSLAFIKLGFNSILKGPNARLNPNLLSTDPGASTETDKLSFGVQVQI